MKNAHETAQRPALDAATSRLTKATDHLADERAALLNAEAKLREFDDSLATKAKPPKDAFHNRAELEGAVSFYRNRVAQAEDAVTEATSQWETANYSFTEAQVLDRAEALAEFDRDAWAAEFAAEVQQVADRYMTDIYELNVSETEAVQLGKEIGLDALVRNPENRARVQKDTGRNNLTLDGQKIYTPFPSQGLDALRESIRDSRHDTKVAEARAEEQERRDQERAEQKAEREQLEAAKRFERRHGVSRIEYQDNNGATPIVTRDSYGNPVRPMTTSPDGTTVQTQRP